jgi:hypothetical protein
MEQETPSRVKLGTVRSDIQTSDFVNEKFQ